MKFSLTTSLLLVAQTLATPTFLAARKAAAPAQQQCTLKYATLPPSTLPPVTAGLVLTHVAIGRGTQNYSCATNTAASIPAQIGADAKLFNATCLAGASAQGNAAVMQAPAIAYKYPEPSGNTDVENQLQSAHHYFLDTTTPFFDFVTQDHNYGTVASKKIAASPAPNATANVPWLKLQASVSNGNNIKEIYRVNTVGGVAPVNCAGQPSLIYVQYAAEYMFYASA